MENIENIIDRLKCIYCLNISPVLEGKINHLYNTNIGMHDIEEYIVYKLLKGHKLFFEQRDLYDFIIYKANCLKRDRINLLVISNDIGQEIVSLFIIYLLHKNNIEINFYWYSMCFKLSDRFLKNTFNHNYLIKTNLNEIEYFNDCSSHYEIKKGIIEKIHIINGNFNNISLKDNVFDIVYFADRFTHFSKQCVSHILDELYRIVENGGMFFINEDNTRHKIYLQFVNMMDDDIIYFIKGDIDADIEKPSLENAIDLYIEKKYDQSLRILHKLNLSDKDEKEKYKLMLLIYSRTGNIKQVKYLENILKNENLWDADFDFILATYFYSKMDYSLAMTYFQNAVSKINNFVIAIYYIGLIYLKMDKRQSSDMYFKKAYELIKQNNMYNPNLYTDTMSIEIIKYLLEEEFGENS